MFINQAKYIQDLLKKYDMVNIKQSPTPMATSTSLNSDPLDIKVDVTRYRGMIGSLLYLTASRLDIMFAVGTCARFHVLPTLLHMNTVKHF